MASGRRIRVLQRVSEIAPPTGHAVAWDSWHLVARAAQIPPARTDILQTAQKFYCPGRPFAPACASL